MINVDRKIRVKKFSGKRARKIIIIRVGETVSKLGRKILIQKIGGNVLFVCESRS